MYSIVTRFFVSAVVDSASRDNYDVGSLADIEIVIDHVVQTAFGKNNRDMNAFVFCTRFDYYIYSGLVRF